MAQKGYTIKLGLDMTDVNSKIHKAEKSTKEYQKELREVNKLLKFDPTNVNLMNQKQELLGKTIHSTKTKLDELKASETKMQNALKNNDAYQKSYVPLKKSIDEADKELKKLMQAQEKMDSQLASGKISQTKYYAFQKELEDTKAKSISLQKELVNLEKSFSDGHIDDKQYREFQREIESTEQQLKNLEKQAKETNDALSSKSKNISASFTNTGKKLEDVGNKMLPLSTGIVAVGTASVLAMNSVDDGLDVIVKKTGATGDSLSGLKNVFEDLSSEVPDDFLTVGSAVGEVNTRLGFVDETLKVASKDFLEFARINDQDVNESVRLVARAMGDANIPADQYNSLLDMLTVASQKSGIAISGLTENIAKYGAPMRSLGFDTQTSIALFAQWEATGVNVETAFSGMKKSISQWSAEGKDARVEFGKSLEQIKSAPDIASATTKAIEVFGAKAGPDLADAIRGGRFEVDEYVKSLENSTGAVDSTYAGIVDGVDNSEIALKNFQMAMHDLGEQIMILLGNILLPLSNAFKSTMETFDKLPQPIQQIIVALILLVAAAGPILILFGKISTSIGSIMTLGAKLTPLFNGIKTIVLGLFQTIMAHPVIAIITAIVAAVIYLWTNCSWFRDMVIGMINFIGNNLSQFFTSVGVFFSWISEVGAKTLTDIGQFFINCYNVICNLFVLMPAFFGKMFSESYTNVVNFFTPIIQFFTNIYNNICNLFIDIGSAIGGAVSTSFKSAVNSVMRIVDNMVNGFIDGLNWCIEAINNIPGVSLGAIGRVNIPYMKDGGTLHNGQAIVSEAGPELVQLVNGKAVVTPLSKSARATPIENTGGLKSSGNQNYLGQKQPIEITLMIKEGMIGKIALSDIHELERMQGKTYLLGKG